MPVSLHRDKNFPLCGFQFVAEAKFRAFSAPAGPGGWGWGWGAGVGAGPRHMQSSAMDAAFAVQIRHTIQMIRNKLIHKQIERF